VKGLVDRCPALRGVRCAPGSGGGGGPAAQSGTRAVLPARTACPAGRPARPAGIVKCQDLAATFPNVTEGANIVYWSAARLPPEAPAPGAAGGAGRGARDVLNQNGVAYPAWHGPGWDGPTGRWRRC